MKSEPVIGLLDADCFYVSAERLRNPALKKCPVGVLGNHGFCVIAKSYDMKAKGVTTGMPIWEARRLCPEGVYLPSDFRWYERVSRSILSVLRELFSVVEYYSVDEFFMKMQPLRPGMSWSETAALVRETVHSRTGIPCTIGVARTKTLAKMVSDAAKPNGARVVLSTEEQEEFLKSSSVRDISGIGRQREARLKAHGINSAFDFIKADISFIRSLLTVVGVRLWYELKGEQVEPVNPNPSHRRIISRGGSLGSLTSDAWKVYSWLARNLERIVEELERRQMFAGRITVSLRYEDNSNSEHFIRPNVPQNLFVPLMECGRLCLNKLWRPKVQVRSLNVRVDELTYDSYLIEGLYEGQEPRHAVIADLKRQARRRFGRDSLRSGATLAIPEVYRDPLQGYGLSDIHGKRLF